MLLYVSICWHSMLKPAYAALRRPVYRMKMMGISSCLDHVLHFAIHLCARLKRFHRFNEYVASLCSLLFWRSNLLIPCSTKQMTSSLNRGLLKFFRFQRQRVSERPGESFQQKNWVRARVRISLFFFFFVSWTNLRWKEQAADYLNV